jgi:broad specificity phosphatase PhoE
MGPSTMNAPRTPKWPACLVVMRHALSEANLRREYLDKQESGEIHVGLAMRDADVPLTPVGRDQARRAGRFLNRYGPFDVLFVSPYRRTRETADLVLEGLEAGPRLIVEERVREKEFGVLEGYTKHGFRSRFPEEWERRAKIGKYYYRPPGGESFPDVDLRLHSFLGTLVREHAGRRVLVITHSVVVLLFRRLLERMDEQEVLALDRQDEVRNASLLVYELGERDGREGVLVRREWNLVPREVAAAAGPRGLPERSS